MIKKLSVIFDLDGTLIDSQKSILETLKVTLDECGLQSSVPLTKELIGPPLNKLLQVVCKGRDGDEISTLSETFIAAYDNHGYKHSTPYEGIGDLLRTLHSEGYRLYLATNKRYVPTEKILKHLNWRHFFSDIYCIDGKQKPYKDKSQMLKALTKNLNLETQHIVYVGDRIEDYEAATINAIPCIIVNWGYQKNFLRFKNLQIVKSTNNLLIELKKL